MSNSSFLQTVEIFSLLSMEEIDRIADSFRLKEFRSGQVLFREGDDGNDLYIVQTGTVTSTLRTPEGLERTLAEFKSGNFFGEMSIFENAPRSATCIASEESSVYILKKEDFFQIIENNPEIAIKIMYRMLNIMTQRLKDTGELLTEMVHWGEAASKRIITDEFTGIYNRRFLDESIDSYFELAQKKGQPLSLVMIDLDRSREVNEIYGHDAGDNMILAVVGVYKKLLREKDIYCRYGGDEFTVIMPNTAREKAIEVLESIRLRIEQLDIFQQYDGPIKSVTVSQGVATYPESASDLKSLREKADQGLYRAKAEGRNRIIWN